jgi:hypothetical protein
MALILKDRVQETSTTTGTGTLTLAGAVTQFQTFSSAVGNGNTTYYTIYNAGGTQWEVGVGTVGAGTLTRDTVLSSSNANALVSFTGTLYVFGDYPAGKAVYQDANGNVSANAFLNTLQTIAATGGTTTLTVASPLDYSITGSGGQTIKLPDATTLVNGTAYTFNNNQSSGSITVNNNSNTLVASIPSGGYVSVTLLSNATSAGSWDRHDQSPSNVSWSTNTLDYPGSITSATWNGNNIALNRGGTNASLTASAGSVPYSTASALALSAVGTSGQVLTSAGTSAPTWTTPTTGTVTSVTGTAPVVSSGGNTPAISMPAATGSVNGYLTSTDWTTFNNKGSGTVTSVNLTASTGISVSGGPITGSGSITVTNTAPDQTVVLTAGTGISTSGTYPSFTITNSAPMAYPGSGIPNSTGSAWGTSYTTSGTGTVVALAASPTLNNPTVTNYVESVVAIGTVTTTNTIALTNGTVQTATLTASIACTFTMPTATAGKSFILLLKQAASVGLGTATFTGVKWGTAGAPTITATAGKMDILTFVADGTNWYGSIAQGYTP